MEYFPEKHSCNIKLHHPNFLPLSLSFRLSPQAPLDQASEMSLVESGFEPGKRNFLQLSDKDGEQPQIASVSARLARARNSVISV